MLFRFTLTAAFLGLMATAEEACEAEETVMLQNAQIEKKTETEKEITRHAPAELLETKGTCESDTGGTCSMHDCDASRNAECKWKLIGTSKCVCPAGTCASDGKIWKVR